MKKILVGVDGSAGAQKAMEWSAQTASRANLDVVAVRVFDPKQIDVPAEESAQERDRQRRELEDWCESVPLLSDAGTSVVTGDAADALLDAAREHAVDLLVVGERGSGGFPNLHVGSVAHHLAHHTTMPLAIIPPDTASRTEHLVVGVDGSDACLAAVDLCAELAPRLDVAVTAVHAFEPFVEWIPGQHPDSWRRAAEDDAETWVQPIPAAGVPVEVVVDRDINPAGAIGRAVDEHPHALAVVGSRGQGGFPGLRLGRVPLQLVHERSAPVIVVPASSPSDSS